MAISSQFLFLELCPAPVTHIQNKTLAQLQVRLHTCEQGMCLGGGTWPQFNLEYSRQCREPDRYFGARGWVLSSYSVCQCVYWFWASNGKLIPVLQYALCTDACRCRAALLQEHTATRCNISLQSASLSLRPRGVVQPCCKNTLQHTATFPFTVDPFL